MQFEYTEEDERKGTATMRTLAAGNLRGGQVLHEIVDRHAAVALEPRLEVQQRHADVAAQARLGDGRRGVARERQHVRGLELARGALHVDLIGGLHVRVEHLQRNGQQAGVRHPGAVVARLHLAQLVGAHFLQRGVVGGLVVANRNLSSHAAHRVHAATVASLDQQLHVRLHERQRHGKLNERV